MICIIVENESDIQAFKNFKGGEESAAKSEPAKPKAQESAPPQQSSPPPIQQQPLFQGQQTQTIPQSDRVKVTPYAKKLAAEQGISLQSLQGSGPGGRIIASDISGGSAAAPVQQQQTQKSAAGAQQGRIVSSTGQFEDIQLTNMRKTIAKRLTESKSTIPHYYLTSEIVIDDLLK